MVSLENEIEPLLIDMFSDESTITESSDSEIDSLWFEVGKILESEPLDQLLVSEKVQMQPMMCEVPSGRKRVKGVEVLQVSEKRRKEAMEDDIKREIRMARNRASAERTRLRRLEHIKNLEFEATRMEAENNRLADMLRIKYNKKESELRLNNANNDACVVVNQSEPARRSRSKKADAADVLSKLEREAESLPAEELARLRKEARMARNRASAERTRIRRLEAARNLETRVTLARAAREKYIIMLRSEGEELPSEETDSLSAYDDVRSVCSSEDEGVKPCAEHEVAQNPMLCKTGPVSGDLQSFA